MDGVLTHTRCNHLVELKCGHKFYDMPKKIKYEFADVVTAL